MNNQLIKFQSYFGLLSRLCQWKC